MFDWIKPQRPALTPEAVRAADALVRAEGLAPLMRAEDGAQAAEMKVAHGNSRGWLTLGALGAMNFGLEMLDAGTKASKEFDEDESMVGRIRPGPSEMSHPRWDMYWGD